MERLNELIRTVSEEFNGILRANLYEVTLKQEELLKLREKKRQLRFDLKNCGIGDLEAKKRVKLIMKDIFIEKLNINDEKIEYYIPFSDDSRLSVKDKFDIVLYLYKDLFEQNAFINMVEEYGLLEPVVDEQGFYYEISEEDVLEIYRKKNRELEFHEKLEILCQKVYEAYRGLGVIDELRDMKLDGISAGVSGKKGNNKSVWAFIKGKTVHLNFLDFESERELERVCMNIYRYNHPGQLSMNKGYIVNEMKDHSRVVVARPPFCESFVLFVRKFDTIEHKRLEDLLVDENKNIPIEVLKWIVRGCQVCGITGAQGCGKTTLLMALIGYIHPAYTLRIQELAFELHLRDVYENRNIVTFQETDFISGQEGLDLQKKTDGVVNILGEVATAPVASWLVQMSMVASLFTMFTHHAKTTKGLIKYLRNSLLTDGAFRNERVAEEQVVDVIRFDIHLEKDIYGHRYIERITEIIPCTNSVYGEGDLYKINNIVEYIDGEYVLVGSFSKEVGEDIMKKLTEKEREEFSEMFGI